MLGNGGFGDVDLFYRKYYDNVLRAGRIGAAQDRSHVALEKTWGSDDSFPVVLEVGAGAGGHHQFIRHRFDTYYQTDVVTPDNSATCAISEGSLPRVILQREDAERLSFSSEAVDRVIATCLLLHLREPETALREWRRVTKPGGVVSILLPCEPGILLRATRRMVTAPKVRALGYRGYDLFNARDHRNHVGGLDRLIRHTFRHDTLQVTRFPFPWKSWNLNYYFVYQIRKCAADD